MQWLNKLDNILNIWGKEIKETLRDKRTLFIMTLLPILLYPSLMLGMTQLIVYQLDKIDKEDVTIAIEGSSQKINELLQGKSFKIVETKSAWDEVYLEKAVLGLKIPENFDKDISDLNAVPRILVYYSGANDKARLLLKKVRDSLNVLLRKTQRKALQNSPPGLVKPFTIALKNTAGAKKQGAFEFGRLLALLVVLMAITFPLYPAIDMGAGEKERGTMETLLVAPATRFEIVVGKYLAIFSIAIFGSLLNLASMGITFGYFTKQSNALLEATRTQEYQSVDDFKITQLATNDDIPHIREEGKISHAKLYNENVAFTINNNKQQISLWHIKAEKIMYRSPWTFANVTKISTMGNSWIASTQNRLIHIFISSQGIGLRTLWQNEHIIENFIVDSSTQKVIAELKVEEEKRRFVILDTKTWQVEQNFDGYGNIVDGNINYIIFRNENLQLLDTQSGEITALPGYKALLFNKNRIVFFTESTLGIYDTRAKAIIREIPINLYTQLPITAVTHSNNNLVLGTQDGVVQLWSYKKNSFSFVAYLGAHEGPITHIDIFDNYYLSLDETGTLMNWSTSPPLKFDISNSVLVGMFILLIPLVGMFSALCLGLSIFARSYKEGQHYLTPMVIVVMPLVMVAFLPNMHLTTRLCFVPVSNIVLLYKEMFLGNATFTQILLVFFSTALYALLALIWAIRLFSREEVIFRQVEGIKWDFWRKNSTVIFTTNQAFIFFALTTILFHFMGPKLSNNILFGQALSMVLFLVAVPVIVTKVFHYDLRKTFAIGEKFPVTKIPVIIALSISGLIFALTVKSIQDFILPIHNEQLVKMLQTLLQGYPLWIMIIVFAVLPGICEELFFRGLLLSSFRKKMSPLAAVVWTALLFAVMHMDISRLSFTFVMGIFLGIVLLRTENILVPIVIHILCNSTTLTIGYYAQENSLDNYLYYLTAYPWISIPGSLIVSGFIIKYCFQALGHRHE
ncbi:CPBP family glutamic-type intramembrane protease [Candidatus Uabimicrobium amorphum]|uniref:ABC transporter permease n=1 Tax=Uabimicrobium amorphum TaxID=2596890 RepID=A0A5S9IR61_UABAM|nr:CPBP family glutamic-type intramembrane protease [Candidatus Uabimicrobium amorphum]BBM86061.1 ABC transporter permease [Candidatus Uabimicrobium amorphum]